MKTINKFEIGNFIFEVIQQDSKHKSFAVRVFDSMFDEHSWLNEQEPSFETEYDCLLAILRFIEIA